MADTQIKKQETGGGFGGLCTAIIAQSIIDYQELCDKGVSSIKNSKDDKFSKKEIVKFAKSDWCKMLLESIGGHINQSDIVDELNRQEDNCHTQTKILAAYSEDGDFIKSFNSLSDGARFANLKSGVSICQCCKGVRKTAGGYIWRYI